MVRDEQEGKTRGEALEKSNSEDNRAEIEEGKQKGKAVKKAKAVKQAPKKAAKEDSEEIQISDEDVPVGIVDVIDLDEEDKEDAIPIIDDFDEEEQFSFSPAAKTLVFVIMLAIIAGGVYWYLTPLQEAAESITDNIQIVNDNLYHYKDYEFSKDASNLWKVELYDQTQNVVYVFRLHYGPKDFEDIPVVGDINNFKNIALKFVDDQGEKGATFVTVDPDVNDEYHSLAFMEFVRSLETGVGIKPFGAYTAEVADSGRPVKRCTSTTEPVIYIKKDTPTFIWTKDNCVVIQGQGEDLVKAVDKALLMLYGVYP